VRGQRIATVTGVRYLIVVCKKKKENNELHIYRRMQGWHAIHGVDE